MKKLTGILILVVSLSHTALASELCVLNYERQAHPFTKATHEIFDSNKNAKVVDEALPSDFVQCVQDGSEEIVLIAHALEVGSDSHVTLGYFRRLAGVERAEDIKTNEDTLVNQIHELEKVRDAEPWPEQLDGDTITDTHLDEAADALQQWIDVKPNQPLYVIKPFLDQTFSVALSDLQNQLKQNGSVALKKIRLMSCEPQSVLAHYSSLTKLIKDFTITLDIAPQNSIMSFFEGKTVTSFDKDWLKQSN